MQIRPGLVCILSFKEFEILSELVFQFLEDSIILFRKVLSRHNFRRKIFS